MKSIYFRNFFATALLVGSCFIIIAAAFFGIGRTYVISEYRSNMINTADEVSRSATAFLGESELSDPNIKMVLTMLGTGTGNLIMISDDTGLVVSCSDISPRCAHVGAQLSEEVLAEISGEGLDGLGNLGGLYDSARYNVSSIILDDGGCTVGYAIVSNSIDNMLEAWRSIQLIIILIAGAVFIIALLVSLAYWRKMAKPLDLMAAASAKFARGDFSVRVPQVSSPEDEMGALIVSFNNMADSLQSAEKRRSEFISNISHELRTPMTTISGFADGLLDGTVPKEDTVKYLTAIRDETKRLSRLVRDMLDVSRAGNSASDPARRIDFDLTELVLQTLLSFESRATAKDLDVDPQLPDTHIMVHADKDAITRVIYNLIDNAVKFANAGSCITIRLYKDDEKAYCSVKDEGEVIPPEDLPFIFDRFHKSDRSRSLDKDGVGLGLYLVKSIINAHNEDIAVRSENGMTEFAFTLALTKFTDSGSR